MRFVYAMIALTIISAIITCLRISGVAIISDDASLISIAIMTAGALAGGD